MNDDEARIREAENRLRALELFAQQARQRAVGQYQTALLLTQAGGVYVPPPAGSGFIRCGTYNVPVVLYCTGTPTVTLTYDGTVNKWIGNTSPTVQYKLDYGIFSSQWALSQYISGVRNTGWAPTEFCSPSWYLDFPGLFTINP